MRFATVIIMLFALWGCSDDETPPVTPDTTPPTVVSTSPADGETNVSVDAAISITFSEEMDPFTFSTQSFQVVGEETYNIIYSNKTVTLTLQDDLLYDQNYTVVVTTDVTDVAENPLDSNYTWEFTTTMGTIMPLAIGNKWEFWVAVYDTVSGDSATSLEFMEIVRDTLIATEQWYIDNANRIYKNKDDGLWSISSGGQPYLFLKFPATMGDSYFGNPDLVETIRVESTGVLIAVPHGNHVCYYYLGTVSDPTFKYKYYYNPNFGPISIEKVTSGSSKVVERRSLIRLTLQ